MAGAVLQSVAMLFEADPFPPTAAAVRARLDGVRPAAYARTRNALDGAVTRLSPYITHGLLTLPEVLRAVAARHRLEVGDKFVFELGWREFFRHVWAMRGDAVGRSIHAGPLPDEAYAGTVPDDVRRARTNVPVVDQAVRELYATGWLHNHARMWLASYVVHLRKVHWRAGADWMLAHLLDGDLASNHLSWQWVAGTASHKPYLFNADNVARHAPAAWHSPGSVVDRSYESLDALARDPLWRADVAVPGSSPVDEPGVFARPPAAAGAGAPGAAAVAGRRVWLLHPWALRAPPPGMDAVGVLLAEAHERHPWSARRWAFVAAAMREQLPDGAPVWHGTRAQLAQALAGAAAVHSVAEPHLPELEGLATLAPAPRLFAPITRPCGSFSQWWRRATADVSDVQALIDGTG